MTEILVLPEMEQAGMEALVEGRKQGLSDLELAVACYMAMRCVFLISVLPQETVH